VEDPGAFGALYDQEFSRVYNYVRYRVRDADTADELTSRTFTRALERLRTFDSSRGAFATWLLAIARNCVTDEIRGSRRWGWVPLEWTWGRRSDAPDPEETLAAEEEHQRLYLALRRLTERERDLLGLKFAGQRTSGEIAQLTGLKDGHVRVLIFRALEKLRAELAGQEVHRA
jgi:RNA polymerase sigma-70 factor (ECF subfamily)